MTFKILYGSVQNVKHFQNQFGAEFVELGNLQNKFHRMV